jgi:FRG domain-containing protein
MMADACCPEDSSSGVAVSRPPMGRLHECKSWEEFQAKVRSQEGKILAPTIYRGQRDPLMRLSSRFERWLWRMAGKKTMPARDVRELFSSPEAYESSRDVYRQRFRSLVLSLPFAPSSTVSGTDWWILGRHHGLVTPLLDWTRSPYVAAFFALTDRAEHDNPGFLSGHVSSGETGRGFTYGQGSVAIWALARDDRLKEEAPDLKILEPTISFSPYAQRIHAQASTFTMLDHRVHVDLGSYLEEVGMLPCLDCYEIPAQEIGKALRDLSLMNINFATLFPDFDGAARQANIGATLENLYHR